MGTQAAFVALGLEVAVVAAYGLILPRPILAAPRLGCLNVHASLLPRWRGAAPIQRAILAGDRRTGVTIMQMEEGLDTGPMLAAMGIAIERKTAGELTGELARLGAEWMVETLARLHQIGARPQPRGQARPMLPRSARRRRGSISPGRRSRSSGRCAPSTRRPAPGSRRGGERIKLLAAEPVEAVGEPGEVLDEGLTIACGDRRDRAGPRPARRGGRR
jgi:methionyl-tRNA formyltransferase